MDSTTGFTELSKEKEYMNLGGVMLRGLREELDREVVVDIIIFPYFIMDT